ncbi:hypothetical protein LCGC14_2571250 [marine sediment metagenome]|uniref:Uncharacterized protein n=1 Tax=marine sediment metagenome TaxID=412755 RepID=A0A0F9AHM8_9ZZZZ
MVPVFYVVILDVSAEVAEELVKMHSSDEALQEASSCCDNWWKDLTPEMKLFLHYQYHDIRERMKDWPSDLALDQHRGRFEEP